MTVHPEGVVTFGEAAAVLGVAMPVIRGLVAQGILQTTAEYRNGFSKLLPAADVQGFEEGYVATSVLARRFHLHSGSFARHLKESGSLSPQLALPGLAAVNSLFRETVTGCGLSIAWRSSWVDCPLWAK